MTSPTQKLSPSFVILAALCIAAGIAVRWLHIAQSDFIFYDEGYYLNEHRRAFVEFIAAQHLHGPGEWTRALYANLQVVLGTGKALWLYLSNLRVFLGWKDAWYFPRILSAVFGTLTLGLLYLFSRRYFNSNKTALWSVVILAVVPSHVFYSRLAMQEAFSTFCVLLGFYFYLFPPKLNWRTFLSSFIFMLAYFSSYRLIIIPILTATAELFFSLQEKRFPDIRKYFWHTLVFVTLVLLVGSIDEAQHWQVILPWMFYQRSLAEHEAFQIYNLLSYPYYTFKLESVFFGLFFWANFYWLTRRQWLMALPFILAGVQMGLFSFAEDKAARYICIVYPFMAMAVASVITALQEKLKEEWQLWAWRGSVGLLLAALLLKSAMISQGHSDYRLAAHYLQAQQPQVKFLTSQKWVMDLYTRHPNNIEDLPHDFPIAVKKFSQGFQFIVIDPQAYVSWTEGQKRFTPPLENYLGFVSVLKPVKVFSHLDDLMLERFVLEHNSDLKQSLRFIDLAQKQHLGEIRIYDLKQVVDNVFAFVGQQNKNLKKSLNP